MSFRVLSLRVRFPRRRPMSGTVPAQTMSPAGAPARVGPRDRLRGAKDGQPHTRTPPASEYEFGYDLEVTGELALNGSHAIASANAGSSYVSARTEALARQDASVQRATSGAGDTSAARQHGRRPTGDDERRSTAGGGSGVTRNSGVALALHVPGDHSTISEALSSARDGDTIVVGRGIYRESLVVDKQVQIVNQGAQVPTHPTPLASLPVFDAHAKPRGWL